MNAEHKDVPRSIVAPTFKTRYHDRAAEMKRVPKGLNKKVLGRGCGDWLHRTLALHTLTEKGDLDVALLEAILTENGVKHEHWNRTTNGWQGRLRMTGRLALQRVVAEHGYIMIDGTKVDAPKSWVAQYLK